MINSIDQSINQSKMMNGSKIATDLIMNKVGNFFRLPDLNHAENGANNNKIDFKAKKVYFNGIFC